MIEKFVMDLFGAQYFGFISFVLAITFSMLMLMLLCGIALVVASFIGDRYFS